MEKEQSKYDYLRIEKAIGYIRAHQRDQPSLEQIAAAVHLSPYHFQRLFTRWAGVSPKKFLQYLTLQYARECLRQKVNLEEVAQSAGLSGTGRLHDLFVNLEGMTPDVYRKSGQGLTIRYGFHSGPFGNYLLAITDHNKICSLQFMDRESSALEELKRQWRESSIVHDQERSGEIAACLFGSGIKAPLSLMVRGTHFQLRVWEALLKIPFGRVVSYQDVASWSDNPGALQAVGSAIGRNPVAFLIPCHRVIRKTGHISEYRWGSVRKQALLGWEAALVHI